MSNTTKLQITEAVLNTMYRWVRFGVEEREKLANKILSTGSHALEWADGSAGRIRLAERVRRELESLEHMLKVKETTAADEPNAVLQTFCNLYEETEHYLLRRRSRSSTSRMANLVDMELRDEMVAFLRAHDHMYKDAKWHLTGEEK